MNIPKVAVIVCTYNMVRYLPESLDSVLELRYPNLEIVVVDDGSTDGTQDLIKEKYPHKVTCIRQENRGLFAARNTGIKAVPDADYYSIVDADDRIHPLKVWDEVAFLERHPEVAVCFSNIATFQKSMNEAHLVWDVHDLLGKDQLYGRIENPIEKIAKYLAFTSVSTLRATALHAVGNYDYTLKCSGDFDLAIRLTRVGGIGFINKARYLWRRESQGMTTYIQDRIVVNTRIFEKVWENSSDYSDEELKLLKQQERTFTWQALKGIAADRVDRQLTNFVQRKLLQDATWRDIVKLFLIRCVMHLGIGKATSAWKARRRIKQREPSRSPSIEKILDDMSVCFDSINP